MASGLPVIATSVGGVPDLVRDGETGYLVEPHDEAALAAAVIDLVEDSAKRALFGQRARTFIEQYHAIPRLAFELHNLYDAVLHEEYA
jgi:glycosyltransferase involved in cell wall biosynthesis